MYDVYVIGCGGIGGAVLSMLPQVMACLNVDLMSKDEASQVMVSEGIDQRSYTNRFCSLNLIDGDRFSGHNALRQAAASGSKLAVQMDAIRKSDIFTVWLNSTNLRGYDMYIKPSNMGALLENSNSRFNIPIFFLGVDNHKTRYEVTRWLEDSGPDTFLLINGGNTKITGNVTVFEKYYGTVYDPPIYKLYPEVTDTADKRPDEVSCDTVTTENDQTVIINHMIASIMLNYFRKYIMGRYQSYHTGFNKRLRQKGEDGRPLELRILYRVPLTSNCYRIRK